MMVIMFSLSQTVSWEIPSLLSTILSLTALALSPGAVPDYRASKTDSPLWSQPIRSLSNTQSIKPFLSRWIPAQKYHLYTGRSQFNHLLLLITIDHDHYLSLILDVPLAPPSPMPGGALHGKTGEIHWVKSWARDVVWSPRFYSARVSNISHFVNHALLPVLASIRMSE